VGSSAALIVQYEAFGANTLACIFANLKLETLGPADTVVGRKRIRGMQFWAASSPAELSQFEAEQK
jgi:hypothetical protein